MSYHIQGDSHWRISKSGYSIKTGFANNSRIVASFHAPVPLDSARFEKWLEDAQHACDLHNASVDAAIKADARITELETAITVRDAEISKLNADLELARVNEALYLWLRDNPMHPNYPWWNEGPEKWYAPFEVAPCVAAHFEFDSLEAAIDAARKEQTP